MKALVQKYALEIQKEYKTGNTGEHSFRPALKNLLDELNPGYNATNEPKRVKVGAPDFVITHNKKPIGYGETKDIGKDLDIEEKSEQVERYLSLNNLFLTDYLDFRFFFNKEKYETVKIGRIENKKIIFDEDSFEQLARMFKEFTQKNPITITSSLELTKLMANKAKLVKEIIYNAITGEHDKDTLTDQYNAFKEVLIHDLTKENFADMYAQTIAYGFFIARFYDKTIQNFSRHEAQELVPKTNPFLRQFFQIVAGADLDERIRWIVDDLASLFGYCDIKKIMGDFKQKNGDTDPVIHFYENFLSEYDPRLRKSKGVYYTPKSIVSFIVRSVDEILKKEFGLTEGLADSSKTSIEVKAQGKTKKERNKKEEVHKVQILDPAIGTGTFLKEVIGEIHQKFKGQEGAWNTYVKENLIPRLHGFEIMMAPYTICHLALGMELERLGYDIKDQRLGVYLTNSLEPYDKDYNTLFARWLSEESNQASKIKNEMPIMVVMGNPPYSGISQNKGKWITDLIDDYKYVDGKHFGERKHWLQDDYVKFIRLGENYINKNKEGVLAYVNNHSFLDNPTFRGMRWHLLNTFDKIYILDLHGNAKKKEVAPDGTKDENVFDIQQGVSINIFIKTGKKKKNQLGKIYHADLYGKRNNKYEFCEQNSVRSIKFEEVKSEKPYYFFVKKDFVSQDEYEKGFKINELFPNNVTGIVTMGDSFIISESKKELEERLNDFISGNYSEQELKEKYRLGKNYAKWILENKNKIKINPENFVKINYRPFDTRWTYFNNKLIWRWREKTMKHFIRAKNTGLVFKIGHSEENSAPIMVSKNIIDFRSWSRPGMQGGDYIAPIYLYNDEKENIIGIKKSLNINNGIWKKIIKISDKISVEDVMDYIYAILYSPKYRVKYKELLKIDFPRVPYPKDEKYFFKMAKLGEELRQLHLLESSKVNKFITTYPQSGDNEVKKVKYEDKRVYINDKQYFGGVPQSAWEFYIGGYQPAQKWLKDRKGKKLSSDDINHYQKMIVALSETERIMGEIDKVIKL